MPSSLKRQLATPVASVLAAVTVSLAASPPGRAADVAPLSVGDSLAQTIYLPIRNQAAAEAAVQAMQTPGPGYHKFLSVAQFVAAYGPSDANLSQVKAALTASGYTIQYMFPNHLALQVVSTVGAAQRTLGVTLKRTTVDGRTGIVSTTPLTLPASLQGLVRGVGGLNTIHHAHPMRVMAAYGHTSTPHTAGTALVGGTPGNYLPVDFAKFYDVNPIYGIGVNGRGTTIGIVTLANFYPTDAYEFWKAIGLNVSPTRITTVSVDGGASIAPSDELGEGETDLDVEESGGIAPGANERIYIAPNNTNANFIDGFEAAASENIADTVSSSWGQPELDFFADAAAGQPSTTYELDAFHDAFLEMALQGQSLFIAAGDSGSFDTVRGCSPYVAKPTPDNPLCNAPYTVDHPSADPLVTAAGGTTLPLSFKLRDGTLLSVAKEQAWGWDYISNEAAAQGHAADYPVADFFSTGGGGGVSAYFAKPWYQVGVKGITLTKPNQVFTEDTGSGPVVQNVLPANFAGRNSPDLSTDADPYSGYQYIEEGAVSNFYGGTSFVAPQLNGVTALFVQGLGGRVGLLNPVIYGLGSIISNDVAVGDNWGYQSAAGYENADGNGTLDATRLALGLAALKLIH